ncbi:MAG: hypothetical protein AMXMBFR7_13710 [Planctomycetota bacterium]
MDGMPSHSNASPRPARTRFRFTLADLLLFAGLCGLALALVEPLIAQGFGTPPQDRSNAVALVLILTAAGAFIGVWRSRMKLEKAESSVVEVVAYVAIAWAWSFALYRWNWIDGFYATLVAIPGFALAWWVSAKLELRGEWHVVAILTCQIFLLPVANFIAHPAYRVWTRHRVSGWQEYAVIDACKTYAEAQDIYRRVDYDEDGVREYALAGIGDYSLYEVHRGQGDLTLIDAAMAQAFAGVQPKAGYFYKILTAQGPAAYNGALNYLEESEDGQENLVNGYAMVAWPATYCVSGKDTFIVSHHGTVYQKDLGPNTANLVAAMSEFNPDSTWVVSE